VVIRGVIGGIGAVVEEVKCCQEESSNFRGEPGFFRSRWADVKIVSQLCECRAVEKQMFRTLWGCTGAMCFGLTDVNSVAVHTVPGACRLCCKQAVALWAREIGWWWDVVGRWGSLGLWTLNLSLLFVNSEDVSPDKGDILVGVCAVRAGDIMVRWVRYCSGLLCQERVGSFSVITVELDHVGCGDGAGAVN